MHTPKPPPPDPAVAAAQAAEQRRAEAGQISQTQAGLSSDTVALRRRFGVMAAGVGTPQTAWTGTPTGSAGANAFSGILPANAFSGGQFNFANLAGIF